MALLDILKTKKTLLQSSGQATSQKQKKTVVEKNIPVKKQDSPKKQKTLRQDPGQVTSQKQEKEKRGEIFSHVLIRPRISEKAALQSGGNSYIFDVAQSANKIEIKKAIKEIYNVSPIKVNIIHVKSKQKIVRGILGRAASFKKAIVFLKDGDSIELV